MHDLLARPVPPLKLLLTVREAAESLGVSIAYLRERIRLGEIPVLRLPTRGERARSIRIAVKELEKWIERQMETP